QRADAYGIGETGLVQHGSLADGRGEGVGRHGEGKEHGSGESHEASRSGCGYHGIFACARPKDCANMSMVLPIWMMPSPWPCGPSRLTMALPETEAGYSPKNRREFSTAYAALRYIPWRSRVMVPGWLRAGRWRGPRERTSPADAVPMPGLACRWTGSS